MAEEQWDGACAAAYLLRTAADLIRDDTPFHNEVRSLCRYARKSLRVRVKKGEEYAADTVMSEAAFRNILLCVLEWDADMIDKACEDVREDAHKKRHPKGGKHAA